MKKCFLIILISFIFTQNIFAQDNVFTRKTACGLSDGVHLGNVYLTQDYDFSYQTFYKYGGKLYGTWNDNSTRKQTTTNNISIKAYNCQSEKWTEITNISPNLTYDVNHPSVSLVTPNFIVLSDGDISNSPYEGNRPQYAYIVKRKDGILVMRIDSSIINNLSGQKGGNWQVSKITGKKVIIKLLGTKKTVTYTLP